MKKILSLLAVVIAIFSLVAVVSMNASAAGTDFKTAADISVNTQYNGNISESRDRDFYKFTLDAPGFVYFDFQHENLFDSAEYWYAVIYNSSAEEISGFSFYGTDTSYNSKKIGLDKGTYYLRIVGGDYYYDASHRYNTCDYKFILKFIASNWEKENNEAFSSATVIDVNRNYSGTINDDVDKDFYKFTITDSGNICINFKHKNLNDSAEFWYAVLYNTNTNEICGFSFYGTDTDINSKKIGLDKGTYYLRIVGGDYYYDKSHRYNDCDYNFTVNFLVSDWEKENNEEFSTATVINANKTYSGSINDDTDRDFYKFTLDSPGSIYLNFKHKNLKDSAEYWYAVLYNDKTDEITGYILEGSKSNTDTKKVGLDKGTYYLRIVGGDYYYDKSHRYDTCDYNLTVKYTKSTQWEKENNEEFNTATKIDLYKTYNGSINGEADKDFYKIYVEKNQDFKISFNSKNVKNSSEYYYFVVYDDGTNEIEKHSFMGNEATQHFYVTLNKGTYYFRIVGGDYYYDKSHRYTTADYSFKIAPYVIVKSCSSTENDITIKWSKVAGAKGYEIFKYDTKKKTYVKAGTTTQTSYTLKDLKSGTSYKFKIRAYIVSGGKNYYGDFNGVYTASTKPAKVNLKSVKSAKTKTATVTWDKVSGASGYAVVYATDSKFKKAKTVTVKKGSTLKATIKKLSKGKKYFFKVRAYKTVNGKKVYGAYSAVKNVKVK